MFSLNEDTSLSKYNFLELTAAFLEINIIPWTNLIASNDYTFCWLLLNDYTNCLEWLYFLWIKICFLNEFIFLIINKYIISLKLNKYNSFKLHKYTISGYKIMLWVQIYFFECEYMYFLNFASFTNGQP